MQIKHLKLSHFDGEYDISGIFTYNVHLMFQMKAQSMGCIDICIIFYFILFSHLFCVLFEKGNRRAANDMHTKWTWKLKVSKCIECRAPAIECECILEYSLQVADLQATKGST